MATPTIEKSRAILQKPFESRYADRIARAYYETTEILGIMAGKCNLVSSAAARGIRDAGLAVESVSGYYIPVDDIRLHAIANMPVPRAEYTHNHHCWLRFPKDDYSLDITHSQVNPEIPLLLVPTSLEEVNGIFYRKYEVELLHGNSKEADELRRIWRDAFIL